MAEPVRAAVLMPQHPNVGPAMIVLMWMAILAVVFLAEKLMPARWHLDTVSGIALLLAAAFLGLRPPG